MIGRVHRKGVVPLFKQRVLALEAQTPDDNLVVGAICIWIHSRSRKYEPDNAWYSEGEYLSGKKAKRHTHLVELFSQPSKGLCSRQEAVYGKTIFETLSFTSNIPLVTYTYHSLLRAPTVLILKILRLAGPTRENAQAGALLRGCGKIDNRVDGLERVDALFYFRMDPIIATVCPVNHRTSWWLFSLLAWSFASRSLPATQRGQLKNRRPRQYYPRQDRTRISRATSRRATNYATWYGHNSIISSYPIVWGVSNLYGFPCIYPSIRLSSNVDNSSKSIEWHCGAHLPFIWINLRTKQCRTDHLLNDIETAMYACFHEAFSWNNPNTSIERRQKGTSTLRSNKPSIKQNISMASIEWHW